MHIYLTVGILDLFVEQTPSRTLGGTSVLSVDEPKDFLH